MSIAIQGGLAIDRGAVLNLDLQILEAIEAPLEDNISDKEWGIIAAVAFGAGILAGGAWVGFAIVAT